MSSLGERISIALMRLPHGQSETQIAKEAGLKQSVFSDLKRGEQKSTGQLVPLARALRVRPDWLFDETGPMDNFDLAAAAPLREVPADYGRRSTEQALAVIYSRLDEAPPSRRAGAAELICAAIKDRTQRPQLLPLIRDLLEGTIQR